MSQASSFSDEWVCPMCTLRNLRHLTMCEACGTNAPHYAQKKQQQQEPSQPLPPPIRTSSLSSPSNSITIEVTTDANTRSPHQIAYEKLIKILDEKDEVDPLDGQLWTSILPWIMDKDGGELTDPQLEEVLYWHSKECNNKSQTTVLTLFRKNIYRRMLQSRFPLFFLPSQQPDTKSETKTKINESEDESKTKDSQMVLKLTAIMYICERPSSPVFGEGYLEYCQYRYLFREGLRQLRNQGYDLQKLFTLNNIVVKPYRQLVDYFSTTAQ